jgi:SAM-dependent methyltransferase
MLALARSRASQSDTPERLHFVQADMRDLVISDAGEQHSWWSEAGQPWAGAFDLALCTYDSLNYLLSAEELGACFRQVAGVVRPGGLFVADMNTRHFLEHDWGEYEVLEQPSFVQVTQSSFDPANATSTMLLSGFVGDDAHGYRRFDETHIERAYPAGEVAALLRAARYHVEATYECFTFDPLHERAQRVAWVARRRMDDLPTEGE